MTDTEGGRVSWQAQSAARKALWKLVAEKFQVVPGCWSIALTRDELLRAGAIGPDFYKNWQMRPKTREKP